MEISRSCRPLPEAIIISLALVIFSYFIHSDLPLRLVSFVALLLVSYIIGKNLTKAEGIKQAAGSFSSGMAGFVYCLTGLAGGILLAILYRWHLDMRLLPKDICGFSIVAALIGGFEEIVFRGYIQGSLRKINAPLSILSGTLSHTCYKCSLFLSPSGSQHIDIIFLGLWTFTGGLVYGIIRHYSGSVIPALLAHMFFDIIVYAEYVHSPWWVW